ncbi:MAG: TIGR02186 family protein [Alphaproteobacteria bacterium]|nr:TIGR02186 family protein [Alphaproteobacteria bacterium]
MRRWLLVLVALAGLAVANAEDLAVGLTEDIIRITSSFTGAEIVMYGAIEAENVYEDADERDIVVVVRGAEQAATVRKRARVGGVWVNADEAVIHRVPDFYYLASTKDLARIAAPAVLARNGLGLDNLPLELPRRADAADFRKALIRNKLSEQLFHEDIGGVTMNGPTLFQTRVRLPANVPTGQYTAEAYLFRDGQIVSAYSAPLEVDKSGVERAMYNFAQRHGIIYGLATILIAVLMGLGAAYAFREKD